MKFIIQNKTLLTYGLTLVNLVAIVLFSLLATTERINDFAMNEKVFNTIDLMDKISFALANSEADVNKFILTSEEDYILQYRKYRKPLQENLSSLETIFSQNKEQKLKLMRLKNLIDRQIFVLESVIQQKKNKGILEASEFLKKTNKDKCMEQIRWLKSEIIQEQKAILKTQQDQIEFSRKSREYIIVSASIASLLISIIAIGTIVTDLDEKREREKFLENMNENKDRFFTLISHDLKGPAQNLIGISELLLNDASITDEERKTFLEHMHTTAKKNYSLLENLLEWSRVQMGMIVLNPQLVNLAEILHEALIMIDEKCMQKKLLIHNDIPKDMVVFADFNSIKTVLRNLLTNAVKYTPAGGEISISCKKLKDSLLVMVKDTGIGMNQETKSNLFNPGKTVSRYGTDGETGTGIGLLLCKEFVEKNKGEIWVESEEGAGTCFCFTIPLKPKS